MKPLEKESVQKAEQTHFAKDKVLLLLSSLFGYLFLMMAGLATNSISPELCIVGSDCHAISRSPFGTVLGVETRIWGGLWISLILVLMTSSNLQSAALLRTITKPLLGVGAFLAILLQIANIGMYQLICIWCILTTLSFVAITASSWVILKSDRTESRQSSIKSLPIALMSLIGLASVIFIPRLTLQVKWSTLTKNQIEYLSHLTKTSSNTSKTLFVFTDFGCEACRAKIPTTIRQLSKTNTELIALVVSRKPVADAHQLGPYYYIALKQNFGKEFLLQSPGITEIPTFLTVVQNEFKSSPEDMTWAQNMAVGAESLFQDLDIKATPTFAVVLENKIGISTNPMELMKVAGY